MRRRRRELAYFGPGGDWTTVSELVVVVVVVVVTPVSSMGSARLRRGLRRVWGDGRTGDGGGVGCGDSGGVGCCGGVSCCGGGCCGGVSCCGGGVSCCGGGVGCCGGGGVGRGQVLVTSSILSWSAVTAANVSVVVAMRRCSVLCFLVGGAVMVPSGYRRRKKKTNERS